MAKSNFLASLQSSKEQVKEFIKKYSDKHKDLHANISKIGKVIDKVAKITNIENFFDFS